jgi:putative spermidine/putrescine transport system permease protein
MIGATAIMFAISLQDRFPNATALTLGHYAEFLGDGYMLTATARTFYLAFAVTLICLLCGYPVAWFLVFGRSRFRNVVFVIVLMPLLVSIVVRTLGWTILLGNEGIVNRALIAVGLIEYPIALMRGFWTVAMGMVHIFLPFMVLSIASTLGKIDQSLPEAAALLGARPSVSFRLVTLPLSIQGIASGSIIVFCLSTGVFLTPLWLSRGSLSVLATNIKVQVLEAVDWPAGATGAMVLTALTVASVAIYSAFVRNYGRQS